MHKHLCNVSIPETERSLHNITSKLIKIMKNAIFYHSAGKHDRGPLFFTLFSFRLIRSRLTGSI